MKNKKHNLLLIVIIFTVIIAIFSKFQNKKIILINEEQPIENGMQEEQVTIYQEQRYENIRIYYDFKELYQNLINLGIECKLPDKEFDPYICKGTGYKTIYEIPQLNISFTHEYYVLFSGIENDYRVLFKDKPFSFFISGNSLYYIDRAMVISGDTLLWGDGVEPFGTPLQDQNIAKKYGKKIIEKVYFAGKNNIALKNIKDDLENEISILYENVPRLKPDISFLKNDELNNFLNQIGVNYEKDGLDCYKSWLYVVCFKPEHKYYYLIHMPIPNENLSPLKNLKLFK